MKLELKLDANDQEGIAMEQRQSLLSAIEKMKDIITIVIQIGNSDDKLTQKEWSEYINEVFGIIENTANEIHFSGCSSNFDPWQNACFVFEMDRANYSDFCINMKLSREHYKQDSIALTQGSTIFI